MVKKVYIMRSENQLRILLVYPSIPEYINNQLCNVRVKTGVHLVHKERTATLQRLQYMATDDEQRPCSKGFLLQWQISLSDVFAILV